MGLLNPSPMWYGVGGFIVRLIMLSQLIEFVWFYWRWIFFIEMFLLKNIVSSGFDNVNPNTFPCELITWDGFHDFWYFLWLFYSNYEDPYIVSISCRKCVFPWYIICWLWDIRYVVMLIILGNDDNGSISWWKSYSNSKYIIFDEGVVL